MQKQIKGVLVESDREESRKYRLLLIIPVAVLVFSVALLVNQYTQTGEWFQRSIELRGGKVITLITPNSVDTQFLEQSLEESFGDVIIREIRGLGGTGVMINTDSAVDSKLVLQKIHELGIPTEDYSIANIGPALGEVFWVQAQTAIIVAFIFMGIIVFIVFRILMPSLYVIAAAASDIVITLGLMQLFGIELSLAGLAALLMIIGYSVDTDILLTTRILKSAGETSEKIRGAFKTGITMSMTSIGALAALLLSAISPVLSQIAAVLLIGLIVDIMNTWLQNSVLLRWYTERKGRTYA